MIPLYPFMRSPWAIIVTTLAICLVPTIYILHLYFEDPVDLLYEFFEPPDGQTHGTVDHGHNDSSSSKDVKMIESWPYVEVVRNDSSDVWPYRVYKSAPWNPPNLTVTIHDDSNLAEGLLFFNPTNRTKKSVKQSVPFIIDPLENEMVYGFDKEGGTSNFRMQELDGEPHLTFWKGETVLGHGYGHVIMLDKEYRERTVDLDNTLTFTKNIEKDRKYPGPADFHEHQATDRNSIIVTAYNNTPADLSHMGGKKDSWVSDSQFYEIDASTNEILFSWSAMDHLPLSDSQLKVKSYMGKGTKKKPFDFFHINSVEMIGKDYLVNSRHMFAFYLISGEDGHIIWEFSGRGEGGSFGPVPDDACFRWAHHARAWNVTDKGMTVSLFDNHMHTKDVTETGSRGLMFELELPPNPKKSPKVLRNLHIEDEELFSNSQGSYHAEMNNGNQLMGYGPIPVIREFGPYWAGSPLLWQIRFGVDNGAQNYRAGKYVWHGTPADWDPSLVAEVNGDKVTGYVSWNGATEVRSWNVYASQSKSGDMELVAKATRKGFETVFELDAKKAVCVQIGAVQDGEEIRRSNKVCP